MRLRTHSDEEVTWEVWRSFGGAKDTRIAGNMTTRQARELLKEAREYPIEGLTFYRVKATTTRQRVEEP